MRVHFISPSRYQKFTPSGGSEGNSTVWLVGAGLITVAGLAGFTVGKPSIPKEDTTQPAAKVRLTQAARTYVFHCLIGTRFPTVRLNILNFIENDQSLTCEAQW